MKPFYSSYINSPLGAMIAVSSDNGVCHLGFLDSVRLNDLYQYYGQLSGQPVLKEANRHLEFLEQELDQYFHGNLKEFESKLDLKGTEFQLEVWTALCSIVYGVTCSYKYLANKLELINSYRAVANANGKNPVSILVPCHRVIGSDGTLTGYSGGLDRKKRLLQLELANTPQLHTLF